MFAAVSTSLEFVRYSPDVVPELTPSTKKSPRAGSKVIPWLYAMLDLVTALGRHPARAGAAHQAAVAVIPSAASQAGHADRRRCRGLSSPITVLARPCRHHLAGLHKDIAPGAMTRVLPSPCANTKDVDALGNPRRARAVCGSSPHPRIIPSSQHRPAVGKSMDLKAGSPRVAVPLQSRKSTAPGPGSHSCSGRREPRYRVGDRRLAGWRRCA